MKIKSFLKWTLLFSLVIVSFSCKKKEPVIKEFVMSDEIAKYVSYVSAGKLFSEQSLEIVFLQDVVTPEQVGKELENNLIKIKPSINGKIIWTNERTLTFVPEEPWEMREVYDISIDLTKVSELFKDAKEKLEFSIYIEGQDVEQFKGELILKERNNPKILKYVGKVTFKLPVDQKKLEEAFVIKKGLKKVKLFLQNSGDNLTYTFETEDLPRNESSNSYSVTIDDEIGLLSDYQTDFEITPIQKLTVTNVIREETGQHPRLKVVFSDDLDSDQDITKYFSVKPNVKLIVSKMGNTAVVDGKFKYGSEYQLTIKAGVLSRWATKLEKEYSESIKFSDLPPIVEFASEGMVLPTSNNNKLQFRTSNLSRVHIEVKKVFDNQLSNFVRNEQMSGEKRRHTDFNHNYGGQNGTIILNKTLELGNVKNEWLLSEIDLSEIIKNDAGGLYLVRLNFNPRDMLVETEEEPYQYVADNGEIYKPIVVSDLGIIVKREGDTYNVFVTDLITTKPVSGANVEAYRYWNEDASESGTTNSSGYVQLSTDYGVSYISAEKDGQITYLKLEDMQWNTSGFDVEGVSSQSSGLKAFVYTERGVYRPGDNINLSVILRNESNTFPTNHPISLVLYNPEGQNVLEKTLNSAIDGFYNFNFKTNDSDPTGNWEVRIEAGSGTFYHTLKIETVVPFKLKVRMDTPKDKIGSKDTQFNYTIRTNYLFGAPASGLSYDAEVEVVRREISFPKYSNFIFSDASANFIPFTRKISSGRLDSAGMAKVNWTIPEFEKVPSGLTARLISTVYEKGGRPNVSRTSIPVSTYDFYVGIKNPSYWYHYVTTNEEAAMQVVCVDNSGNPVENKKLKYRIYQNSSSWWYHYDERDEYEVRFKTDNNTTLVKEGSITSGKNPVSVRFTPREDGDYLIEVQEGDYNGHQVSQFLYAYAWGSVPSGDQNAGTLIMRADKSKYAVGEVAKIKFPVPKDCSILYTLECENKILEWEWIKNTAKAGEEMQLDIPVTSEMVPNTYVTISVIQPHEQTKNDRPMRMFGILPLLAEDSETRQDIDIIVAKELKPNKPFEVTVQTRDTKPTQFTIAVVDEGLLDLTNFETPDPWKEFFKKLRLDVLTYDVFSQIIGANKGDIYKVFSIGGDMDYREKELSPEKGKKRFKPVCLFKGPVSTDANGRATVKFNMPDYNGSVRIMVVSAKNNTYGSAEKAVPVRTDLMVEAPLPRVLGPGEEITVPVSVFAMKDNIGSVNVSVKVEGPLTVLEKASQALTFTKATDKECYFKIKSNNASGQAKIIVTATSSKMSAVSQTDIMVRPSSPRQYATESKRIKPGESVSFTIPNNGISGTNTASLKVQLFPNMNFDHRLEWLIRYPYGCVEQTTSSVFPQLYLKSFVENTDGKHKEIDKNINAGIDRLTRFQTSSGGMSYWPGESYVNEWASNYVAHFLTMAKNKGYNIPSNMYNNLMEYLQRKAGYGSDDRFTRVYRAYILSIAEMEVSSELNSLKQDMLDKMDNVERYLLAAAYYNTGKKSTATEILEGTSRSYKTYEDFSYCYGSAERDMGFVLSALVDMDESEDARLVAEEIAKLVSTDYWYSTHSLGYMLLSLGRYFDYIGLATNGENYVKGSYILNGTTSVFGPSHVYSVDLKKGFGKEIVVKLDADCKVNQAYVDISWSGVPLMDTRTEKMERLNMSVEWLNEEGDNIDPSKLAQASTIFGHFTVTKNAPVSRLTNIALVQIVPSGWEIENLRLSSDQLPSWTSSWTLNRESYMDIRDDRIMWFFDLGDEKLDFLVKVNVVTRGSFYMPPTICEAMYNNNYSALIPGRKVSVTGMSR